MEARATRSLCLTKTQRDLQRYTVNHPYTHTSLLRPKPQSGYASEILYGPTIGVVKISTLLLFARIFTSQRFKHLLWAVGLFITTYSAAMALIMTFQCQPIKSLWDPSVKGTCIDRTGVWIVMGSMNVLTDILLLCLPLPQLWRLQMARNKKLQTIGIFSIGSLSVTTTTFHKCLTVS